MVEKTEGEAALRINSSEPGEGLEAYQKVYLWFAGTTGLALSERTRMLIHPEAPKREEDVADALEKWGEQERHFKRKARITYSVERLRLPRLRC